MSLRILLADDNITAQRLGSKILTEAGHEVIAVSNGAAAVKKIASDKPDLLILDVYMPGYSGLEVCDKVKNDPATAHVPVILTVTNMEPFNPSDANRVRCDGTMIKPFEASDLIAVVQKFEGKRKPAGNQADYPQTIKMAAVEDFKDASYEEWKAVASDEQETAKFAVPLDIASAPALAIDEPAPQPMHVEEAAPVPAFGLEDHAPAFEVPHAPEPVLPVESTPSSMHAVESAAPAFGLEQPAAFDLTAHAAEPAAAFDVHAELAGHSAVSSETIDAHSALSASTEFEPTSAAPVEVQVAQAAELESTLVTTPEVAVTQDPGLVTDADEMAQFTTHVGQTHPENDDLTVGVAMPGLTADTPAPAEPADDFATMHAAAYATTIKMEAYSEPQPVAESPSLPTLEHSPVEDDMHRAFAVSSSGAAAAPAPIGGSEPQPEVTTESAPVSDELVARFAAELEQAHHEREVMSQAEPEPSASEAAVIEASREVAKEVPQLDEEKIAAAVTRAIDRYKEGMRAELIQAIVRELKG